VPRDPWGSQVRRRHRIRNYCGGVGHAWWGGEAAPSCHGRRRAHKARMQSNTSQARRWARVRPRQVYPAQATTNVAAVRSGQQRVRRYGICPISGGPHERPGADAFGSSNVRGGQRRGVAWASIVLDGGADGVVCVCVCTRSRRVGRGRAERTRQTSRRRRALQKTGRRRRRRRAVGCRREDRRREPRSPA
jgi:hypothetical protein